MTQRQWCMLLPKDRPKSNDDSSFLKSKKESDLAIKIATDLTDAPEIVDENLIKKHNIKMETVELSHWYGDNHVLAGISMPIFENKVTAIIGPSGCGKSTFLRDLNRMNDLVRIARVAGKVLLDGQNIYAPDVDVVQLRKRIGMVFQKPNPFPMSIENNVFCPLIGLSILRKYGIVFFILVFQFFIGLLFPSFHLFSIQDSYLLFNEIS